MRPLLLPVLLAALLFAPIAHAEEAPKPDDHVVLDISAEDWVTTKTARVAVSVEAAVNAATSGTMRADMIKAVNSLAAADWRLTSFNRSQDQTGMERWSANFEARLPETALGGISDSAKKLSKAGMQLSVGDIDFSPTLDEVEAVRSTLRTQLYKKAADQLTALNSALPGRAYRIAGIDFSGGDNMGAVPRMMRAQMAMASNGSSSSDAAAVERSEKIRMMAHIVLATAPNASDAKH
jgi:predicted secreted protein